MSLTRNDAHLLIDRLDAADVGAAVALLRQLSNRGPVREFRGFDLFDGDEDLGERSPEILRADWAALSSIRRVAARRDRGRHRPRRRGRHRGRVRGRRRGALPGGDDRHV